MPEYSLLTENPIQNQANSSSQQSYTHSLSPHSAVTFLMVLLIQNTQNCDANAVRLKLDELIRAIKSARNELVDLEDLSDGELKTLEEQFKSMRKQAENDGSPWRHTEPSELR